MKFKSQELLRALQAVERVLSKRSLPFYRCVFVEPDGVAVRLSGSNGDQVLSVVVGLESEDNEAKPFAIPGEELIAAVTAAPAESVEMVRTGDATRVSSGAAEWTIQDLSGVDIGLSPSHPTSDDMVVQHMIAGPFQDAITRASYAASRSQSRPGFMQVRVTHNKLQASDGYRFHEVPLVQQDHEAGEFLIPQSVLDTVLAMLEMSEDDEVVALSMSPQQGWIRLAVPFGQFTTGRLSYPFPDIDSLIVSRSEAQKGRIRVDRSELAMALRVAQVAAEEGIVRLSLQGGELRVSARSTGKQAFMDISVVTEVVTNGWSRRVSAEMLGQMIGKLGSEQIEFRVEPGAELGFVYAMTEIADVGVERASVLPVPGADE